MPNSKLKDLQGDMHELILWHDASETKPRSWHSVLVRVDKNVLVATSIGHWDDDCGWRDYRGYPASVAYWAELPEGPQ